MSTCAAEYITLSDRSQHLAHVSMLLEKIDQDPKMKIFCDNQAAILIAGENALRKKTKYLMCSFYFINDFIRQNDIKIQWTNTLNQHADIFTKRLRLNKLEEAIKKFFIVRFT